ncbi:MAG: hypothetical protein OEW52_02880 [Thermoleophilia bacterium]|nr:hypothetical protein [Thermoleophilia bacterium]
MSDKEKKNSPPRHRKGAHAVVLAVLLSAALTALVLPLSGAARPQAAPANTSPPTITGSALKGETLVAGTGSWTGTAPISFAFEWRRCDSAGANCTAIPSATNTTYVLVGADVGARIRVLVSASNAEGSGSALSEATSVVTDDSGAPKNTADPSISGTPNVGQRLTATTGTWTGTPPISFSYQWVRCGSDGGAADGSNCNNITGATGTSYVLVSADTGWRIRVRVTGTNAVGSTTWASNATAAVKAGVSKPVNTQRPSVSGTQVEGSTLTVNRGSWTGGGTISFTYQWLRCDSGGGNCVSIPRATGTQYRLTSSDVGRRVRVNVTARNSAGSTTAISGEQAVVAPSGPVGVITLPSGEKSIPVTSVPKTERLIVDQVRFTPNPIRSQVAPFSVQVRVKDTRGFVVRDAIVFVRSTPLVSNAAAPRRPTLTDGWVVFQMTPRSSFPQPRNGYNVQFFVKAYKNGDNPLAGIAGYRLVQVKLAR